MSSIDLVKLKLKKHEKGLTILLLLAVPVILLLVFSYYPLLKLIQMSFSDWDGYSTSMKWVGFANFKDAFSDSSSWQALLNTFAYVIAMIVQIILALSFAIILETKMKASNFFKSAIFMPNIMNGVAIAFMFNYMYSYTDGPLNIILKLLGLSPVHWLPNNYLINFSLAAIGIWQFTGFNMVIFITGLKSIPAEQYEAASIDGASFLHIIKSIIIPSIIPVIELNLFLGINGAMQAYFQPWIITDGGPSGMSTTFVLKSLTYAFKFNQYGRAAVMALIMMCIILTVISIQRLIINRRGGIYE